LSQPIEPSRAVLGVVVNVVASVVATELAAESEDATETEFEQAPRFDAVPYEVLFVVRV
jgi:hypothetical protein